MKEKLGMKARDRITGLTGIVIAYDEWLNGCVRVGLQSQILNKDGEPMKAFWFNLVQIEFLGEGLSIKPLQESPGGTDRAKSVVPFDR